MAVNENCYCVVSYSTATRMRKAINCLAKEDNLSSFKTYNPFITDVMNKTKTLLSKIYNAKNRLYVLKEGEEILPTPVRAKFYSSKVLSAVLSNYLKNLPINGIDRKYKYFNSLRQ